MQIRMSSVKVVGNISGIESTIKVFKIKGKTKTKIKEGSGEDNYVFKLTEREYLQFFLKYYEQFPTATLCDLCNKDMQDEKNTYLIVNDVGNSWLEPRYAICENCNRKI